MASVATTVSISMKDDIISNHNMSSLYLPTFDSLNIEEKYDEEEDDQFFFPLDDEESIRGIDENGVFVQLNNISKNEFEDNKVEGEIIKEENNFGRSKIPGSVSMSSFNSYNNKNNNKNNFPRTKSALKMSSLEEPIPICTKKKSWKNMPIPDMEVVKMKRTASINSFHNLYSQDSGETSDDEEEYVSFASHHQHRRTTSAPEMTTTTAANAAIGATPLTSAQSSSIPIKRVDSAVSFQNVTVRQYDVTIGDNPSVSYGTPVSLDWNYSEGVSLDLNEFESNRLGNRRSRREMHMNHYVRKNFLLHGCGYSAEEVKKAQKNANKIRNKREITKQLDSSVIPFGAIEELGQSIGRTIRSVVNKKKPISHCRSFSEPVYPLSRF